MTFADHFSTVAARYAAHRPHYPPELARALAERCPARQLAWDAGCGNGQLSAALAEHFDRVIGVEPSPAQLALAAPHPRIEYRRATAEASGIPDHCADLAVAAQAAHWFDWPRYVAEVARTSRAGALAALVSYGTFRCDAAVGAVLARFYVELGPYWPAERAVVEGGYAALSWPWPVVDAPELPAMRVAWTQDEVLGYVASWSASARLLAAEGPARLDALAKELAAAWPADDRVELRWALTVKLARIG